MSRLTDTEKFYAIMFGALVLCVVLVFWESFLITCAVLALPFTLWWLNDRRERGEAQPAPRRPRGR